MRTGRSGIRKETIMREEKQIAYVLDGLGNVLTFERFAYKKSCKTDMEFLLSSPIYQKIFPTMKRVEVYVQPQHVLLREYAVLKDEFGVELIER